MKRIVAIISLLIISIMIKPVPSFGSMPENSARSALLMEVESGRILYEKNAHAKMPMASTTKIMTALLAIENCSLDEIIKVAPEASGVEGSSIYLSKGEKIKMEDLLYGLMLQSGNDAAAAIAYHISGSIDEFAKMMNEKAISIGAKNTYFKNPHGLHHNDHYTTAYDLALIASYAMKNPIFGRIVSTKYRKIPWQDHEWDRTLMNKNALLWEYEGANGIKTGYTMASRRCLVSAAKRGDMQLVGVVLNCQPWFDDSATILDYGFREYEQKKLFSKGESLGLVPVKNGFSDEVELVLGEDIRLPLSDKEGEKVSISMKYEKYLKAPIIKGAKVGTLDLSVGDFSISKDIYTASKVEENSFPENLKRIFKKWSLNGPIIPPPNH